jgi:hypothetical protein
VEHIQITCPACGQQVEAVARDSWVQGYCAIAQQRVDFQVEKQGAVKAEAKKPAVPSTGGMGRDSKGRFVKGNTPANKKAD